MKTNHFVPPGRLLAAGTLTLAALPALATSNGLCGPSSCTLIATINPGIGQEELFYRPGNLPETGAWYDGDVLISTLGGADWQPVVGDYNQDGLDDLAVYRDGVFVISWNADGVFGQRATATYSMSSGANWNANSIPVTGDWDGVGGDDLGLYTDGEFTLFTHRVDSDSAITISFGNLPQNPGYVFTQMPFTGPIDNNADGIARVGVYYGGYAQYAPVTHNATHDFMAIGNNGALMRQIERPSTYTRPVVVNISESPGPANYQLVFIMPPDLPGMGTEICSEPGYACPTLFRERPQTQQPVVLPPPVPFQ